jgi:UDP-2,3-diacylglucosamine hydrolase
VTTLFISDLHLCPTRPRVTEVFLEFLRGPAREAQALYILGDLFEYWAGDDDLDDSLNRAVVTALAEAADDDVKTFFIHGNRDFLAAAEFARAASLTLLGDPTLAAIEGQPTLLMHGDTLCADDIAYQQFRAQVRDPKWIANCLAQPLVARKRVAEDLRRRSESAKQQKSMEIMDVNPSAVESVLRAHNYPRLIHGHTHRPARHVHSVDGHHCERWVLADWYEGGSYLKCSGSLCQAIPLA